MQRKLLGIAATFQEVSLCWFSFSLALTSSPPLNGKPGRTLGNLYQTWRLICLTYRNKKTFKHQIHITRIIMEKVPWRNSVWLKSIHIPNNIFIKQVVWSAVKGYSHRGAPFHTLTASCWAKWAYCVCERPARDSTGMFNDCARSPGPISQLGQCRNPSPH